MLTSREREKLSFCIIQNVLKYLADKQHIQHIHVFLSIKQLNEVHTETLIAKLLLQDKSIYTSISDHENNEMNTVRLTAHPTYLEDEHGIPVPSEWSDGDNSSIQLIFMPLMAYDLNGHRLGYGKGFYDRFLPKLPGKAVKAGLSYFPPENQIPVEPHDIPLDLCFSPEGILKFTD